MRLTQLALRLQVRLEGLWSRFIALRMSEDGESTFLVLIARLELILSDIPFGDDVQSIDIGSHKVESPASIVLLSWRKLEAGLDQVRRSHRLEFTVNEQAGMPCQASLSELLVEARILSTEQHLVIQDLRALRNQVARCKYLPDLSTAKRYELLTLRFSKALRKI